MKALDFLKLLKKFKNQRYLFSSPLIEAIRRTGGRIGHQMLRYDRIEENEDQQRNYDEQADDEDEEGCDDPRVQFGKAGWNYGTVEVLRHSVLRETHYWAGIRKNNNR